jgi:hypothetical protein
MWLTDTQSKPKLQSKSDIFQRRKNWTWPLTRSASFFGCFIIIEIGVGLTAFGLFFMLMGVMMFFDGGLLAIGNVRIGSSNDRNRNRKRRQGVGVGFGRQ